MGHEADDPRVHKGRAFAGADVVEGFLQSAEGLFVVAAVTLHDLEIGEGAGERSDGPTGRLVLHRDRDCVSVVLDQEQDRQPPERRAVQRLPEFALAGRAVAAADENDPVPLRGRRESGNPVAAQVALRVGRSDRVEELCPHATRVHGQTERSLREVRGHLPPAGGRIRRRPPGSGELFDRRESQPGGKGPVPVVGEHPVGLRPQQRSRRRGDRFVPGGTDLEERLVLPFESDFPEIDLPGGEHRLIGDLEFLRAKRWNVFGFAPHDRIVTVPVDVLGGALRQAFGGPGRAGRRFSGSGGPPVGARKLRIGTSV